MFLCSFQFGSYYERDLPSRVLYFIYPVCLVVLSASFAIRVCEALIDQQANAQVIKPESAYHLLRISSATGGIN